MSAIRENAASPYDGLASNYDQARPSYPDASIVDLVGTTGLVVDVGAGTGIFTRQVATLLSQAEVLGLEPSADMRRMAQSASGHLGNIAFMAGSAEDLPFATGAVAAITAATAVHWFDRPAFYGEAFRCLQQDGRLVILQNIRRWWDNDWLAAYEDLHESLVPGYERGTFPASDGQYRPLDVAAELSEQQRASSVTSRDFEWNTALPEQEFVKFSLTSTITQRAISTVGEAAYVERLTRLIRMHSQDGILAVDYVTRVVTATQADRPAN